MATTDETRYLDISSAAIKDAGGSITGYSPSTLYQLVNGVLDSLVPAQSYVGKTNHFKSIVVLQESDGTVDVYARAYIIDRVTDSHGNNIDFSLFYNSGYYSSKDRKKKYINNSGCDIVTPFASISDDSRHIAARCINFQSYIDYMSSTDLEYTYHETDYADYTAGYLSDFVNSSKYMHYWISFPSDYGISSQDSLCNATFYLNDDIANSTGIKMKSGYVFLGIVSQTNFNNYFKNSLIDGYGENIISTYDFAYGKTDGYSYVNIYRDALPVYGTFSKESDYKTKTTSIIDKIFNNEEWPEIITPDINTLTKWKIYIDGTKLPNYKILWENKDIEDLKDTDNARIQIQYAEVDPEYPVELRVNELIHETNYAEYNDGNYKTNFKTLYEGAWGTVYDESIMSNLPKQSVWLLLQLDYYENGITTVLPTKSSTKMAVLLNPSGKSLYSYADVWNTKGETDGSTIRIITDKGSGEGDDGYKDDTDKGEEDITDGASNSVGVLTTTYAMTIERLNQLGGFLWGANIFDEFSLVNSNPIENIISCKNIPISLSGTDEIIHLGNVDTGTNGAKVASNFSTLNVGQIALPTKYKSFLDFAPYTKITIYLPYIGFKEIDATIAIGKTLKVAYVADVITGGCIAQIFINGVRFYEFSGEMGVDIPITASNRAQVEASYISNAVGMGASLASGNITGAVDSVLASATAKYNYSSTDTPNANCVASVNRTCYVIIERPTYQELSQFNHTKGKMCNLSKTIGSLKGFTICDANIDLKGITATEQEKQEISSILSSGFFA